MSEWIKPAVVVFMFVLMMVLLMRSIGRDCERYRGLVRAWAAARGWTYYDGLDGRTWKTSLPFDVERHVQFQVTGTHLGRQFTLLYAYIVGSGVGPIDFTAVFVHLQSTYPSLKSKEVLILPPNFGGIGPAGSGKNVRTATVESSGSTVVVSPDLAEARLADEVPRVWSLRDSELVCRVDSQTQVDGLERELHKALRLAELLGIT